MTALSDPSSTVGPVPRTVPTRRDTGRRRFWRIAAAFAVLLALGAYLAVQYVSGTRGAEGCAVRSGDGSSGEGRTYRMSAEQAGNAATISAVGTTRGMPERAVTIALATALQESGLRNIAHGDRDSLGLFQQRPSQGWGTEQQIMDPVYSAGKFYEHLAEIPGYSRLPLTVAAQRVQRSGFPQAYAKHEPDASLLAAALTGRAPASLSCTPPRTTAGTGDAARVRAQLVRDFGKSVLPAGKAPGSGQDGTSAGAPAAPTVSVPVPRTDASAEGSGARRGWELAHWAVARAESLGIDEVTYADRVWRAGSGWRSGQPDGDRTEVRIRMVRP